MSDSMTSSFQAFKARGHTVRARHTMMEPSHGENGFGSLDIGTPNGSHRLSLLTDDPRLLRDLADQCIILARRVEAQNRAWEAAKAADTAAIVAEEIVPADDDVLAAIAKMNA